MKGKKKQPYFPHNIQRIMDAPDEVFQEISYEEFHDWKMCGWELPDSVFCVFRVENKTTGKVKEMVYQKPHAAHKKLLQLVDDPNIEVTVCDNEAIHLISQEIIDDEE